MARKVIYGSIQRTTKTQIGITAVALHNYDTDEKIDLGTLERETGGLFVAKNLEGNKVGEFETRTQGGEFLRKEYDKANGGTPTRGKKQGTANTAPPAESDGPKTMPFEEAAMLLCGDAKAPKAALRKRISRGKIKTVEIDGAEHVILPEEAA
jgi:hypothetical protein